MNMFRIITLGLIVVGLAAMPVFAGQIINVDFDGIGGDGDAGVWTYTGTLPDRLAPVFGLGAGNFNSIVGDNSAGLGLNVISGSNLEDSNGNVTAVSFTFNADPALPLGLWADYNEDTSNTANFDPNETPPYATALADWSRALRGDYFGSSVDGATPHYVPTWQVAGLTSPFVNILIPMEVGGSAIHVLDALGNVIAPEATNSVAVDCPKSLGWEGLWLNVPVVGGVVNGTLSSPSWGGSFSGITIEQIPEPSSLALLALGGLALAFRRRK